ncbi:MAG: hypothetical protein ACRDP6_32445 [Actinoallomurus sp.]
MTASKPTAEELGEELDRTIEDFPWQTSGRGGGMFQVAIVRLRDAVWILVRLQDHPGVQVYSKHEWDCFLDGARRGEFDDLL